MFAESEAFTEDLFMGNAVMRRALAGYLLIGISSAADHAEEVVAGGADLAFAAHSGRGRGRLLDWEASTVLRHEDFRGL